MTDSTHPEAIPPLPTEGLSAATAGQMLRAARQQQGLHLAVLSLKLKVPVRQLEALEADQHDPAKGAVFARALAASVCRQLHIDAAPVLALLPQASGQLPVQRQHMASMQSERRTDRRPMVAARSWPILLVAGLMLGLIAALLWMPSPSAWSWFQTATATAPAPLTLPEAAAPSGPSEPTIQGEPAVEPTAAVPATPPAAGPAVSAQAGPASLTATAAVPAAAALAFAASQESWIEIRDGQNRVLWSRLLRGGESAQVQYPLPMHVVVGRAAVVQVTYQGKPFDLTPHTKVSVARFEVKE